MVARDILEHLWEPWVARRKVRRVFDPVASSSALSSWLNRKPFGVDYTNVGGFTRSSVELMFRDADFEVEAVSKVGGIPLTSRLKLIDQVPTLLRLPLIGRRWATTWEIQAGRPIIGDGRALGQRTQSPR